MWETVIVLAVVVVAVVFVARRLWRESREGSCGCCDTCQGPPPGIDPEQQAQICKGCDRSECKFESKDS